MQSCTPAQPVVAWASGDKFDVVEERESGSPTEPPADAELWSDAQWIAWLKATDQEPLTGGDRPPVTLVGRAVHSAGGRVLGQSMVGLAYALYGRPDDKPAIVVGASSEPEPDLPFTLHLDVDHPERSFVVLAPEDDEPAGEPPADR